MVASFLQRHSSDVTVQLLETEPLLAYAAFGETSSRVEDVGQLVITTDEGTEGQIIIFISNNLLVIPIKSNSMLTIGRSQYSSVVMNHPTVSRHHLLIYSVMAPPGFSNSLVFCQDLSSMNGTFFESRRLRRNEAFLLNSGDCIKLRHAGEISLLQSNVMKEDVENIIGGNIDCRRLDANFQIHDRLIGRGGQAKVIHSIII